MSHYSTQAISFELKRLFKVALVLGLVITALALIGYFFLPDIFYLWMAFLGGGGMIALGVYIRNRW